MVSMQLLLGAALLLYLIGAIFLVIFVCGFGVLLVIYLLTRRIHPRPPAVSDDQLLSVTVQLPIYNEPRVVDRLIDACITLDYPAHKLHIQVLDDSTDHTADLIARKICDLKAGGIRNIDHIRRERRHGYKAGALANALRCVTTDCVAIFDADFVPRPDFLRRTMPHFNSRPGLALIQTRWDHLNTEYNLLTRAQALSIDAHFAVEQVARSRGNLPMSMNGTGGIWRVEAIKDAGGWSSITLTEDLDLSYRAFMRGWEFLYLVDVAVPGELPPLIHAYKIQQARWAMGSTQCLIKHIGTLLKSRRFSPLEKLMGILHLAQYIIQPVMLMLFLLTPPLLWGNAFAHLPNLPFLALVGIIPPVVIALAQFELYEDWLRRLAYFPVHFMTAVAIGLSNSRAVLAVFQHPSRERTFWRTPKFRITGSSSAALAGTHYMPGIDTITICELCLAVYALFGLLIALETTPALAPYMFSYAASFTLFAGWNIYQVRHYNQRRFAGRL
jgi:cellulose synthase/poly-beta-1,6-N-acetylglucosamine synthase-like glycosyltransferase